MITNFPENQFTEKHLLFFRNNAEFPGAELENSDQEDKDRDQRESEIRETDLTAKDMEAIRAGKTYKELAAEKRRMQEQAVKQLDRSVNQLAKNNKIQIDSKEYATLREKIDKAKTPGQVEEIINKELNDFEESKIKEKEANKDKEKILDRNAPEIKEKKQEVEQLLRRPEMAKYIGTNQIKQFVDWCQQAIDSKPSIANAEEVLYKLQNHSTDGIKPREEFYKQSVNPMLKRYQLQLSDCKYLEQQGLSERKEAMQQINQIESTLEGMKQSGLYSFKAKKEILQQALKSDNIGQLNQITKDVNEVTRNESRQFTSINSSIFKNTKVTVHGISIQAMSERSTKAFLDYYKETGIKERKDTVLNWEKIVSNEAKLFKELGEIYKDDPEGFKAAAKNFEHLDYMQKEDALKEHKKTVENNDKETVKKSAEIKNDAYKEIEKAKDKKIICNKTARRFKEIFFKDPKKKFTDSKGKIDLTKLEDTYKQLTSTKAENSEGNRNLAAYEKQREEFLDLHKQMDKDNPNMEKTELRDLMEEFDESTFKQRAKQINEIKKLAKEKEKERNKESEIKEAANLDEKEELKDLEKLSLEEAQEKAMEYVMEGEYAKAMETLAPHWKNGKALALMDLIMAKMKELQGSQKEEEPDKTLENEAKREAEKEIAADDVLRMEMEELQAHQAIDEMVTRSEDRNDRETDAKDRAEMEAMKQSTTDEEDEIIEQFHQQAQVDEMLGHHGSAEKVEVINMDEASTKEDINDIYSHAYREQSRDIKENKGSVEFEMRDKQGRTLERDAREEVIEKQKQSLIDRLTDKVSSRLEDSDYNESTRRIAARRAAKEALENKTYSPLERKS